MAMELASLIFKNYKAFVTKQTLAVKPLTIFIGRNSAGKSSIVRLPLLMAAGLSPQAEAPLNLDGNGIDLGLSMADLIHNRNPHGSLELGATLAADNGRELTFISKVQHFDEYRLQMITRFELVESGSEPFVLEWDGDDPLRNKDRYHDREGRGYRVRFKGLFPAEVIPLNPGETHSSGIRRIEESRTSFFEVFHEPAYLGPFREKPRRDYPLPGSFQKNIGLSGLRAPDLLASDMLRNKGQVLQRVSDWFAQHLGGWPLVLSRHGDKYSLVMRSPQDPSVEINIVDVGTGIAQILPIVVQRLLASQEQRSLGLEVVEQPELHLHPAAHGDLADLFIAGVGPNGAKFLIETHSENFLLRIRRRVAEGILSPEQVAVYWVDSEHASYQGIMPIHIDAKGELDHWPRGVFSEDFDEVRAIRRAQRKPQGQSS